jgi:hypothetical protein
MENYGRKTEILAIFSSLWKVRELLASNLRLASYSTNDEWDLASEKIPAVPQFGSWRKKSASILGRWTSAYDVYLDLRGDNLTNTKRKGTALLRILKELGSMAGMLTRTTIDNQKDWDVFCPMFQKIVSLADDIVELDLKSTEERPPFFVNMALVRPLFEVS